MEERSLGSLRLILGALFAKPEAKLDAKDVRIFCEMGFKYLYYSKFSRRRISPTEVGRRLKLDKKTVESRIKKMEEEGFIKYYQAMPNPRLLDIKSIEMYKMEASDIPSKYEALGHLKKASWVLEMMDFLGPTLFVTFGGQSAEQVKRVCDETAERLKLRGASKVYERPIVGPSLTPSKLDWQIIERLRYDALGPSRDIAEMLSITPRMVDYRISRLLESRALYVIAMINPQKQQGIIFYGLFLTVDETKHDSIVRALEEAFGDVRGELGKIWLLDSPIKGMITVSMFAFAPGEPEEALMKTLQIEGVKQGFPVITKEYIEPERPNWIDSLIQGRISSA